jgi:hypothetical protein
MLQTRGRSKPRGEKNKKSTTMTMKTMKSTREKEEEVGTLLSFLSFFFSMVKKQKRLFVFFHAAFPFSG